MKVKYIGIAGMAALLLAACDDSDYELQNLVPDEGLDTSDPVYQNLNRIWENAAKSVDNRPLVDL